MPHLIEITPAQARALGQWAHEGPHSDGIKLDACGDDEPGRIYVGQGNARIYVDTDGTITEAGR